jgi:hypothetical protein
MLHRFGRVTSPSEKPFFQMLRNYCMSLNHNGVNAIQPLDVMISLLLCTCWRGSSYFGSWQRFTKTDSPSQSLELPWGLRIVLVPHRRSDWVGWPRFWLKIGSSWWWTGICCKERVAKACQLDSGSTRHWKNSDISRHCVPLSQTRPGAGNYYDNVFFN